MTLELYSMGKVKLKKNDQKSIKLRILWIKHSKKFKNITKTCRYFGISTQTYYKWYKRYIKSGKKGLINRSKKPKYIKSKIDHKIKRLLKNWIKIGLKPIEMKNRLKKIKKVEISYSYLQKLSAKSNKK